MDKYANYIKERTGGSLYEDKNGFFTYRIEDKDFYVDELYVVKRNRNSGIGRQYSELIDKIAKDNKCSRCICTVCVRAKNYQDSFNFIKKMGYEVSKSEYTLIYLVKEL